MESQNYPNQDYDEGKYFHNNNITHFIDDETNYKKKELKPILEELFTKSDSLFKTQITLAKQKDEYILTMLNSTIDTKSQLEATKEENLTKSERGLIIEKGETFLNKLQKTHLLQKAFLQSLNSLINIQQNLIEAKENLIKEKDPVNLFYTNNEEQFKKANVLKEDLADIISTDRTKLTIILTKKPENNKEALEVMEQRPHLIYTTFLEEIDKDFFNNIFNHADKDTPKIKLNGNAILKIDNCNLQTILLSQNFVNTKKIFMKNCLKLFGDVKFLDNFQKLKYLSLKNCNIITYTFNYIMKHLTSYTHSLEYLSFENNLITKVAFSPEDYGNQGVNFEKIKELNFSNNRIYRFESNVLGSPDIKSQFRVIYLSSNNFAFKDNFTNLLDSCKSREKYLQELNPGTKRENFRIIIFVTKNLFLLRDENKEEYITYLNKTLSDFNYPLKYLPLEMLFNVRNKEMLFKLQMSDIVQNSLLHLNLSFCSLENKDVGNFLTKYSFPLLERLNISYNNLTYGFFKEYNDLKLHDKLPYLLKIDLSGNDGFDIKNEKDFTDMVSFISNNSRLKKIFLMRTNIDGMVQKLINEIKKKKEKGNYEQMKELLKLIEKQSNQYIKLVFELQHKRDTVETVMKNADGYFKYLLFKERMLQMD